MALGGILWAPSLSRMPTTVCVPALKPLTYRGRSYVRGEVVEMQPIDAAVFGLRGDVGLDGQTPEPPEPPRRRRRARASYRTRDMVADTE